MKKKINKRLKPTQKEKNLFFAALGAGISGGVIGNLLVSSFFDLLNADAFGKPTLETRWAIFVLSLIAFILVSIWLLKKIKSVYSTN